MGHRDLLELRRILRTREDMVQGNRASILTIITKFNEYKQQRIAEIMSTLLQVKQQLVILETVLFLKKSDGEFEQRSTFDGL